MRFFLFAVILLILAASSKSEIDQEVSAVWKTTENVGTVERDKLLNKLFSTYKKENYPENSTIKVGISLLDVNFDADKDIMNSHVLMRLTWIDNRLTWNESEYAVGVMNTLVDMDDFHNLKYKITKNKSAREERTYDCCEEPYVTVIYTLGFQRKAGKFCEKYGKDTE